MARGWFEYEFPVVIGRDAAGVVDAVGDGVDHVAVGDEVIGHVLLRGAIHEGTIAEYAVLPADGVIRKPESLDFSAAAALPLAAAAALAAVDAVELESGMTVLITGDSGGVGSYAIQLAAMRGATVIATGRPEEQERLRGLGATTVVNYQEDIASQARAACPEGVDALILCVMHDADSLRQLASVVREGGNVSSTAAADEEALAGHGLTVTTIMATPDRDTLGRLVEQVERGQLRIDVEQKLPLAEADRGLDNLASGHTAGKIVITLD
jgi:NADPH:quinone reductase-like Zn-dependent oxidoreductase